MTPDEFEEDLRWSIGFALQQYSYQPPRSHNPDERDRYFRRVADAVIARLKLTWTFEQPDILRRKPPSQMPPSEWRP